MRLPKEIQNLILIRYYFNLWKEKIEKVNQQYHSFISIVKCSCRNKSCKEISIQYGEGRYIFKFNYRHLGTSYNTHLGSGGIWNLKIWLGIKKFTVGYLPKKYYFSSGYPNIKHMYDCATGGLNLYKYE